MAAFFVASSRPRPSGSFTRSRHSGAVVLLSAQPSKSLITLGGRDVLDLLTFTPSLTGSQCGVPSDVSAAK